MDIDANNGLKESGRGSSPARGRQRLRAALVIAEMAAALVVLIGAGLMGKGVEITARREPETCARNPY